MRAFVSLPRSAATATALWLSVLALACSSGGQAGPGEPSAPPEGAIAVPNTLGGQPRRRAVRIPPQAGGGYMFTYTGPGEMWTDIYVYPTGNWGPPAAQVDNYKDQTFEQSLREGVISEYSVVLRDAYEANPEGSGEAASPMWFEQLIVRARARGREQLDYVIVTHLGPNYVKLRTTAPEGTATTEEIQAMLLEFIRRTTG